MLTASTEEAAWQRIGPTLIHAKLMMMLNTPDIREGFDLLIMEGFITTAKLTKHTSRSQSRIDTVLEFIIIKHWSRLCRICAYDHV